MLLLPKPQCSLTASAAISDSILRKSGKSGCGRSKCFCINASITKLNLPAEIAASLCAAVIFDKALKETVSVDKESISSW